MSMRIAASHSHFRLHSNYEVAGGWLQRLVPIMATLSIKHGESKSVCVRTKWSLSLLSEFVKEG